MFAPSLPRSPGGRCWRRPPDVAVSRDAFGRPAGNLVSVVLHVPCRRLCVEFQGLLPARAPPGRRRAENRHLAVTFLGTWPGAGRRVAKKVLRPRRGDLQEDGTAATRGAARGRSLSGGGRARQMGRMA